MSPARSPFKFLDSYQKVDADVFFGREEETKALYKALSGVKQLLVYGSSGSGKTSLVECGLRNQFSDADWFALTIRRGANINASVFTSINNALDVKIKIDPLTKMPEDKQTEFAQAVEKLFAKRYQPVYLLFDQFEELLISGETEEKKIFFTGLNNLINYKVPCRIMLIMREEFIGHLSEFEQICPSIFQHRFRVEKMGRKNVEEVIYHILEAPKYKAFFTVEDSQKLAETILSKLPDKRKEIELSHVQVFLGELWDRAQNTKKNNQLPVLSADLIHDDDNLEAVLESFLKKQMTELEEAYGERVPLELLAAMISERFTKLQLSEGAIKADLEHKKVISKKTIADLLNELEQRRIIRTIKVGDETQYEISHDVLALVVGQNLTEEMKMREKAGDIYKVYGERQGLFTQDDIDYLRPFQQSLSYPPELQTRIDESIASIKKQQDMERTRTRKRLRTLYGLLGVAMLALVVAVLFYFNSKTAENKVKVALDHSTKIFNAFYFYEGRFALAYKDDKFYFIDKNGDKVAKLGEWDKAEQFGETGFSKVALKDTKKEILEDKEREIIVYTNYIIDTSGIRYKIAYNIDELKDTTRKKDDDFSAIDLSGQNLKEGIPQKIWGKKLKYLDLHDTQLKELSSEINELTDIIFLNLSDNEFEIFPSVITKLTNLTSFYFNNTVCSSIPKEIGELNKLTTLDISRNYFDDFPQGILKLKNLTVLNLEDNELPGLPQEIGQLEKLTYLDLSQNKLTSLPTQIGDLKNLTELDLSQNPLKGLPSQIWELEKLRLLHLTNIKLSSLPGQIGQLEKLTYLDLSQNKLTSLPTQIGDLENLTELDLSQNPLKGLPSQIWELEKLRLLHLTNIKLSSLPGQIGQLKNLTTLDLYSNQLTSLPKEIGELKNLTTLDLDSNQLTSLPKEIGELKNLTNLYLSQNQLTSLPPQIVELKNLTDLRLPRNKLSNLTGQIGELKNLTTLDLDSNQLTSLPKEIGELKNLTGLYLTSNKLTGLPKEIGELKKLRTLVLSGNKISPTEIEKIKRLLPDCEIITEDK